MRLRPDGLRPTVLTRHGRLVQNRTCVLGPVADDELGEFFPVERFSQDALEAGNVLEFIGLEVDGATGDDHGVAVGDEVLGLGEESQAIHARHQIVGDDHARVELGDLLEGGLRRGKRVDRAGEMISQQLPEGFEDQRFVVHEEERTAWVVRRSHGVCRLVRHARCSPGLRASAAS